MKDNLILLQSCSNVVLCLLSLIVSETRLAIRDPNRTKIMGGVTNLGAAA